MKSNTHLTSDIAEPENKQVEQAHETAIESTHGIDNTRRPWSKPIIRVIHVNMTRGDNPQGTGDVGNNWS